MTDDKKPRKKRENAPKVLTPLQKRFVENYLSGMNVTQSAIAAGYAPNSAQVKGSETLKLPHVREMVLAARKQTQETLAVRATYTAENAIKELDDAILFARDTSNASALVKAIEAKAKVAGLMQDKNPAASAAFNINITGIEPRAEPPMITIEGVAE